MLFQLLFGSGRVLSFTVHEQAEPPIDRMDRAEALRFVKDGFTLAAALAGPVWLAAHKLWRALAGYLALVATIGVAHLWFGLTDVVAVILLVAVHLIIGFEADAVERADLERQGWTTLGSVTGASVLDCQRRFFEHWLPAQPVFAAKGTAEPPRPAPVRADPMRSSAAPAGPPKSRFAGLWRRAP